MTHSFNGNTANADNPFSWAGQASDDPFGQTWLQNGDLSAQPIRRAGLLSTDAPRNDASLIKDFNDELPDPDAQESPLSQSSLWLVVNGALGDPIDLPFDLVIGDGLDLDAAKPVSYEIARTSSQASSTGNDEESIAFSIPEDLCDVGFGASYGDAFLNGINSPGTSFSDANLSASPSLENSPVSPRCPFLSRQAANFGAGASSGNAPRTSQSSVTNTNANIQGIGYASAPSSIPRQNVSALSTGLAGQGPSHASGTSPSSEYFDRWSWRAGQGAMGSFDVAMWDDPSLSEGFFSDVSSQLGPSFVIVPPETTDVAMRDMNDFTATDFHMTSSETHPIDYYLSATYAAAQPTEPRSVPSMAMPQASAANTANRLLLVPQRRRSRRTSDPGRLNPRSRAYASASRPQPIMSSAGVVSPRGSPAQNASAQFPSPSESPLFQRPRPTEPARVSGVTLPMTIASRPGRSTGTGPPTDGLIMMLRPGRPGPVRGRRQGPMDPVSRGQAKETRNRKMVCIRCKHSKQKCKRDDDSLDGSCIGCEKHGGSQRWPGPCIKAHFEDLILSGSCNYVSSYAIYHPTLDHARRVRRGLPRQIDLDALVARLDRVRQQFNLKVYQDGQPLYVLDLDCCHKYMQGLRQHMDAGEHDFATFIDRDMLRTDPRNDEWERCMTQTTTPWGDWLSLLASVNNMPSRVSFSYVCRPYYPMPAAAGAAAGLAGEQPMNVEDPDDADNLVLAAQLGRIMCRKLEVKAYQHLQRLLHESGTMEDDKVSPFLQSLGRILLTLRWRLSWWAAVPEVVGSSDDEDDDEDDDASAASAAAANRRRVEARVQSLCRVLYFYYCCVRRRLPVWTNIRMLSGVRSRYPDTRAEVWDDFPGDESVQGFEAWMGRGRGLVDEAGVANRLGSMGLAAW